MKKSRWYIRIWKHGDYFDLWHTNHFLAGVLCAGLAMLLRISLLHSFLLSLTGMLGWEIFEVVQGIKESPFNKSMDVSLGLIGFLIFYFLHSVISKETFSTIFFYSLGIWLTLEIWGFIAYRNGAH